MAHQVRPRPMRRPRVYMRSPGCGCVGFSIPCLVALAALVFTIYIVGMAVVLL